MLSAKVSGGLMGGLAGVDEGLGKAVLPDLKTNLKVSLDLVAGIKLKAAAANAGCRAAPRSPKLAQVVGCEAFCRHDGGLIEAALAATLEVGLLGFVPEDPLTKYGWEADPRPCVAASPSPPCPGLGAAASVTGAMGRRAWGGRCGGCYGCMRARAGLGRQARAHRRARACAPSHAQAAPTARAAASSALTTAPPT